MLKTTLLASVFALSMMAPAFADCPEDMQQIDAAMETADLNDEDKAQVMELREQGEELCTQGKTEEAAEVFADAKALLGVE